jgi:molecular chaperone GrpE
MTDKPDLKKTKKQIEELEAKIQENEIDLTENKKKLEEKDKIIEEQQEKIEDYHSQLQRMQADFENYKKRSEKDLSEYIRYANENLILKILDTYEDLGRALKSGNPADLKEGVEIIYQKLKDTLEGEGLQEICAEGEKFDPFKHEALMVEDHQDYDNGTVIEELGKGYTLDSKVIKYSKVKVCKKR